MSEQSGTDQRDHIYVIDLSGTTRWTDDYAVAFEVATGHRLDAVDFEDYEEQAEQQIKIYHWRGHEYVLDLSEEYPMETCMNREYRCRHVAYGPPRRLPSECPECHPEADEGRDERPDEWPEMYSAAGRSPSCSHQMHWMESEGVYRCIYDCGEVDEEPPESKIEGASA